MTHPQGRLAAYANERPDWADATDTSRENADQLKHQPSHVSDNRARLAATTYDDYANRLARATDTAHPGRQSQGETTGGQAEGAAAGSAAVVSSRARRSYRARTSRALFWQQATVPCADINRRRCLPSEPPGADG
ncbi:hypothetical protein ACWCO0_25865 [Streptomyces tubercidicus]